MDAWALTPACGNLRLDWPPMTSQPKVEAAPFVPRIEDPTPFSESPRVVYGKNPLEVVICQLRFPAILKISSESPVDFQEALRVWQITLTQDSLALQCTAYKRWEEFRQELLTALDLLGKIYEPSFFTRIGLRYRDVITREALGLKDVPWGELLSARLASEFHSPISDAVEGSWHQLSLRMQGDAAKVTLQHGLGSKGGEVCYSIDSDFYTAEQTGAQNAPTILNYFNRQGGRLFRWCIADRLDAAMEPLPVK